MRTVAHVVLLLTVTACHGDPPRPADPTTVAITATRPPALVAFRDGLDAAWEVATMTSPTTFEIAVHGPYIVAAVCEDLVLRNLGTFQFARTLEDDGVVEVACPFVEGDQRRLTGHMVQAGTVHLADTFDRSTVPEWDFAVTAVDGSYDLFATTPDRIAVQRGLTIAGDTALATPIDVATQGAALVPVPLTVANATPADTVGASIRLRSSTMHYDFLNLHQGSLARAVLAPESVLVATDTQTATVRAVDRDRSRSVARPLRIGGTTAFSLPPAIGDVQFAIAAGQLEATWTTLPEHDQLFLSALALDTTATVRTYDLEISPQFEAETGLTRLALDTAIPGYQPAWRIDFAKKHSRTLTTRRAIGGDVEQTAAAEAIDSSVAP